MVARKACFNGIAWLAGMVKRERVREEAADILYRLVS